MMMMTLKKEFLVFGMVETNLECANKFYIYNEWTGASRTVSGVPHETFFEEVIQCQCLYAPF